MTSYSPVWGVCSEVCSLNSFSTKAYGGCRFIIPGEYRVDSATDANFPYISAYFKDDLLLRQ